MTKRYRKIHRWLLSIIGISILKLISRRISLAANQRLGATLAGLVFRLKPRIRRVIETNLAFCFPEKTDEQRLKIAHRSFCELGKLVFEVDYLWHAGEGRIRSLVKDVEGEEIYQQARARGSVIFASLHMGCWEMAGLYLALDRTLYFLYKSSPVAYVDRFMREGRAANNSVQCPSNTAGIRQLLRACAGAGNIFILPDQVPPQGRGIKAPFFGHPVYTMSLLGKLAQRAPVVFVTAERLPGEGYRLCFSEPPPEIYDPDPAVSAAAINTMSERLIRRCPEQYFWPYKRFRRVGADAYGS